jgi:hypothetical protein
MDKVTVDRGPRICLGLLPALCFFALAVLFVSYAADRNAIREAESLLRDVQKVELNRTTGEEVHRILGLSGRTVN